VRILRGCLARMIMIRNRDFRSCLGNNNLGIASKSKNGESYGSKNWSYNCQDLISDFDFKL